MKKWVISTTAGSLVLVFLLFALGGCGSSGNVKTKKKETQEQKSKAKNTEPKSTTPKKEAVEIKDCMGYDFNNVPRYPNCIRNYFGAPGADSDYNTIGIIAYSTSDSVQDVAKYFSSNLPGVEISTSSDTKVEMKTSQTNILIDTGAAADYRLGEGQTRILVKDMGSFGGEWTNLNSDDPTMHIENYSTEASSSVVSYIESKKEVAGEDPPNLRPSNRNTVRIAYEGKINNGMGCSYLTAEPFGPTVIEYLNKGYVLEYAYKYGLVEQDAWLKPGSPTVNSSVKVTQESGKDGNSISVDVGYIPQ